MNKYIYIVIAVLVIGGGGVYFVTQSDNAIPDNVIPGVAIPSSTPAAKTINQYLHNIEAAYEMDKKCPIQSPLPDCQAALLAIFQAREFLFECYTYVEAKGIRNFKSNTGTRACLVKKGIEDI